jgi:hypothetical protein
MIQTSKDPKGRTLHAVVIVAFDRATGDVRGTFTHASHDKPDEAGAKRNGERLVAELKQHIGTHADLDMLQVPAHDLRGRTIEYVNPSTRELVTKPGCVAGVPRR